MMEPENLSNGSICLPGIWSYLVTLSSLDIKDLYIVAITKFRIYNYTFIPVNGIVVIISHKFIEGFLKWLFTNSPIKIK